MSLTDEYSGVVVNQNQIPQGRETGLGSYPLRNEWLIQEFFLPPDYQRGTDPEELRYPSLSGFQLLVEIEPGRSQTAGLDYELQYFHFSSGWQMITSGTSVGAPTDGAVWMNVYFDDPIEVTSDIAQSRLRIRVRGRTATGPIEQPVQYRNGVANVEGVGVEIRLNEDGPTPFNFNGVPAVLRWDTANDQVYYSIQQGIVDWYASVPNPLAGVGNARAYTAGYVAPEINPAFEGQAVRTYDSGTYDSGTYDGAVLDTNLPEDDAIPLQLLNNDFSFNFRILGLVADSGIDFLGNQYRSVVVRNQTEDITTNSRGDSVGSYWLSRPYPSKFAVESLYFDVSVNGQPAVIDQVLVDPITPGAFFHIYHSNEGVRPQSESEWENKLWTNIPRTFRMNGRETHTLPEPITTKFIKIEFSHLQARYYAPGNFQNPIRYKKHPKWVLDYFLARFATEDLLSTSGQVTVIYDLLDLAYRYYLDDVGQDRGASNTAQVVSFLQERGDQSDRVDPVTLSKINTTLAEFRRHPAYRSNVDTVLGQYARNNIEYFEDYPTENGTDMSLSTPEVSTLNRESLVVEQAFPVMFFYLPCRHKYRELQAEFEHDRAYFVGVREMAFLRNSYTIDTDSRVYVETNGDMLNSDRNDFAQ